MSEQVPSKPLILIISGPAGSGKTTLCSRLLEAYPDQIQRVVTTTTRRPRPGEKDGIDYHFLSVEEFKKGLQEDAFIEWAKVHGRYYGSRRQHVLGLLEEGKDLLLNIDIQGAQAFRNEKELNRVLGGRLHTVFIKPKSMNQLRKRLDSRGSDNEEEIERRLETAAVEIAEADNFDYVIISGTRDEDFHELEKLYLSLRK